MPIPLIPVAIGTSILVTGGVGLVATMKARKRKKRAEKAYNGRYTEYKEKHDQCIQKCEQVDERLAELSLVRMEAYKTLGDAATFLKDSALVNQDKAEEIGISLEQLDHLNERSGAAAEVLGALGGIGIGAAGVSAAWAAAGFGVASTGAAISGLSGAAATSAKLALLGGGALTAGGGGMALGALALGGLPIGPALLVMGFASQREASKFEAEVQDAIGEIDDEEQKLDGLLQNAKVVEFRITELVEATRQIDHLLHQLLAQCSPRNQADVLAVASATSSLSQIVDIAITDKDGEVLNEKTLKDVYRLHLRSTRKKDLDQSYSLLRETVATLEYGKLESALKHIVRIIKF